MSVLFVIRGSKLLYMQHLSRLFRLLLLGRESADISPCPGLIAVQVPLLCVRWIIVQIRNITLTMVLF
jgi:hypothetical protein